MATFVATLNIAHKDKICQDYFNWTFPFFQLSGKDLKIFNFLPRKVLENEDILFI